MWVKWFSKLEPIWFHRTNADRWRPNVRIRKLLCLNYCVHKSEWLSPVSGVFLIIVAIRKVLFEQIANLRHSFMSLCKERRLNWIPDKGASSLSTHCPSATALLFIGWFVWDSHAWIWINFPLQLLAATCLFHCESHFICCRICFFCSQTTRGFLFIFS